ncbi:ATP-binding protein [Sphaerisporangium sp. B11E5]|uniref:YifB family Mg chelatase-like AAA ATPase n=1 Tax=Sphaerisporangium sp. B11E5 TaxID=3153563 RepID=UPI00325CFC43
MTSVGFARVHTAVLIGVTGHLLQVEADVTDGLPRLHETGLTEPVTPETRDRVRAAVINSGLAWPESRTTVSVLAEGRPQRSTSSDLAVAVALLSASGAVPASQLSRWVFLGELGLDGSVRPVRGVLPMVRAAVATGRARVVVPEANAEEACQVADTTVVPVRVLSQLAALLRTEQLEEHARTCPLPDQRSAGTSVDLADVRGNPAARRALEIAAAGGHHIFLQGPAGSPTTMLAERLPTILPQLDEEAAHKVRDVYSAAGLYPPDDPMGARPPLVSPHHTSTSAAIFGAARPGAVSLAHRGVLYLDDAAEFPATILHRLRRTLDAGTASLLWNGETIPYPARFTLVLSSPPCPCATQGCTCTPLVGRRYISRLAVLLDRVEIRTNVVRPSEFELLRGPRGEPSTTVAERVAMARERAAVRLADTPWRTNAEIPLLEMQAAYRPAAGALDPLDHALDTGLVGIASYTRVLRVAWTIADLRGVDIPDHNDVHEALALWKGDPQDVNEPTA